MDDLGDLEYKYVIWLTVCHPDIFYTADEIFKHWIERLRMDDFADYLGVDLEDLLEALPTKKKTGLAYSP